jgi:hypothetical protein
MVVIMWRWRKHFTEMGKWIEREIERGRVGLRNCETKEEERERE